MPFMTSFGLLDRSFATGSMIFLVGSIMWPVCCLISVAKEFGLM